MSKEDCWTSEEEQEQYEQRRNGWLIALHSATTQERETRADLEWLKKRRPSSTAEITELELLLEQSVRDTDFYVRHMHHILTEDEQ